MTPDEAIAALRQLPQDRQLAILAQLPDATKQQILGKLSPAAPAQVSSAPARTTSQWLQAEKDAGRYSGQVDPNANTGLDLSPTTEDALRGFAQGATMTFGDEIQGAAEAYLNPFGGDKAYSEARDEQRTQNHGSETRSPKAYLAGQIGGGLATAAATPGVSAGATARLAGTAAKFIKPQYAAAAAKIATGSGAGAGYGGLAALGSNESDLTTKQGRAQAGKDVATGAVIGTVAGGVFAAPGAIKSIFSKGDSTVAVTNLLEKAVTQGKDPEVQRKLAGKLFDEAADKAGDTKISVSNMLDAVKSIRSKLADERIGYDELSPKVKKFLDFADEVATEGGETTLQVMNRRLKSLGATAQKLKKSTDISAIDSRDMLLEAKHALAKDLEAASENPTLGEAAKILMDGRSKYRDAMATKKIASLFLKAEDAMGDELAGGRNSMGLDRTVDPSVLAKMLNGPSKVKIEEALAHSPEALKAVRAIGNAARVLAKGKGGEISMADLGTFGISPALKSWMTVKNVSTALGSPELARDFATMLIPPAKGSGQKLADTFARLSAGVAAELSADTGGDKPQEKPAPRAPTNLQASLKP